MIAANASTVDALDRLAKVMLSTQTYNGEYSHCGDLAAKTKFFAEWYAKEGGGSKKVDSAIRIFDSTDPISYPEYLTKAVTFGP